MAVRKELPGERYYPSGRIDMDVDTLMTKSDSEVNNYLLQVLEETVDDGQDIDVKKVKRLIDRANFGFDKNNEIARILQTGYEVFGAGSGRDPLQVFEARHYDEARDYAVAKAIKAEVASRKARKKSMGGMQ